MSQFTVEQENAEILRFLDEYGKFLTGKNVSYDGSFAKDIVYGGKTIPAMDTIDVRITDKIRRLQSGGSYVGDNDEADLLGYLVLKTVLKNLQNAAKASVQTNPQT